MSLSPAQNEATRPGVATVGRPRDPAKLNAILEAAKETFFKNGFDATTIEEIAARAKVSKVTIYNRCGDKTALFEAMVHRQADTMLEALGSNIDDSDIDYKPLHDRLNFFGLRLLSFLLHPDRIALERILATELPSHPGLARRFFAAGPEKCRHNVAQFLAKATDHNELSVADPTIAADDLICLWKGFTDMEISFGVRSPLQPVEIEDRVRRGTQSFLKIYGVSAA